MDKSIIKLTAVALLSLTLAGCSDQSADKAKDRSSKDTKSEKIASSKKAESAKQAKAKAESESKGKAESESKAKASSEAAESSKQAQANANSQAQQPQNQSQGSSTYDYTKDTTGREEVVDSDNDGIPDGMTTEEYYGTDDDYYNDTDDYDYSNYDEGTLSDQETDQKMKVWKSEHPNSNDYPGFGSPDKDTDGQVRDAIQHGYMDEHGGYTGKE